MPATCPAAPARVYAPMIMAAGTLKRIHVNQHIIKHNLKNQLDAHACTVQWKGKSYVGKDIVIRGASRVKQRMQAPLSCGARIWIETSAEVEIL